MKRYIKSAVMPLSDYNWKDLFELAAEATDTDILKEIASFTTAYAIRDVILSNPNTTSEVIDALTANVFNDHTGVDSTICKAIARNSKTSKQALSTILGYFVDKDDYQSECVLEEIAINPNTPLKLLRRLAKCGYAITSEVAKNPNASIALLGQLLRNDPDLAYMVMLNPNVSKEIIVRLSNFKDGDVREEVAKNSKTPIDILIKLSEDPSYFVRREVAKNSKTPIEILKQLANDENYYVSDQAAHTLRAFGEL